MQQYNKSKIINVSNRLPITMKDGRIRKASGGLVAAFDDILEEYHMKWVGWAGQIVPEADQPKIAAELAQTQFCPVFLSDEEVNGYYHDFANSGLWPLLHYFTAYMSFTEEGYQTYLRVNERFAEVVCAEAPKGAVVWVHDYHLMLLPKLLREKRSDLKIGFFLHTPFPSFEVFRCHPVGAELLEGLLGADLIGFHTFGYVRHFRSSLLRLLGVDSEMDHLFYQGRRIAFGAFPIGISGKYFEAVLNSEVYREKLASFRAHYAGKKVILGVERLDYTKGIPEKLKAIKLFLERNPHLRDQVVFIQLTVPSREEVEWNKRIEDEIAREVSHINGKFSVINNIPIQFIYNTVPAEELAALYALADVALVTPLIDGMNLVAKEFIACQGEDNPGVLVLSQFAGAAQELFNALTVNPYHTLGVVKALEGALQLSKDEVRLQTLTMRQAVLDNSSQHWAELFLDQLFRAQSSLGTYAHENCVSDKDWDRLKAAKKMALFLDYDGTLREFEHSPHLAYPTLDILNLLKHIQNCSHVDLFIVSGRSQHDLERWLGRIKCDLVAEHGYYWYDPAQMSWSEFRQDVDLSWKKEVQKMFQFYVMSTPGSFMESKRASLVWHYRKSDPEFGEWKARGLVEGLSAVTSNMPVEVRHGKKIVEVSSVYVNKGEALKHVLADDYDVALCVGDDLTDEHMFDVQDARLMTIKVGEGESRARYRFSSPRRLRKFLGDLFDYDGQ